MSLKKRLHLSILLGIEAAPIKNVAFTNCRFENAAKPSVIEFVESLVLHDITRPREHAGGVASAASVG